MRVVVISVGSPKAKALLASIREYESRIEHYFKYEAVEIRAQKIPPGGEAERIIETESQALSARVPAGYEIVALDERGVPWSSEDLAGYLDQLALHGKAGVAFLIGGPLGLSDTLRCSAHKVLALSRFTLPHELARLVLTEQIYRAGTIIRGEPYHKGG